MKATEIGTLILGGVALVVLHGLTKKEGCGGDCGCKDETDGLSGLVRSSPMRPCHSNRCWVGEYVRGQGGGWYCVYRRTGAPDCERMGTPN